MSNRLDAPVEVRELEMLINKFTYRNGLDVRDVFRDMLRYIVQGFSLPDTPPLTDWRYTKEQTEVFYEMFTTWTRIMQRQIKIHGWYDAFGDLFMALTSQRGLLQKGQFFTPGRMSDLSGEILMGETDKVNKIYDSAVGSGRMLLPLRVSHPRSYMVGWDIDYTCCLMCVCNLMMNSCVGEVVCIDSLLLRNFQGAWLVNESYYRTGLPSIRWMNEQEYIRLQRADIPAYVFFLDQENYDHYFEWRGIWERINNLFNDGSKDKDKPEEEALTPGKP